MDGCMDGCIDKWKGDHLYHHLYHHLSPGSPVPDLKVSYRGRHQGEIVKVRHDHSVQSRLFRVSSLFFLGTSRPSVAILPSSGRISDQPRVLSCSQHFFSRDGSIVVNRAELTTIFWTIWPLGQYRHLSRCIGIGESVPRLVSVSLPFSLSFSRLGYD